MGAAVAVNQATWRSIPEDISPQINSWFQFWGHLAIMNLPIFVVEIYNWVRRNIHVHARCCSTVCRLQTSWSTILSICTSKKLLVDAVSNQTVKCSRFCRVGFYWQPGIGSSLDCTVSCYGLLLFPSFKFMSACWWCTFLSKLLWQKTLPYTRHFLCFL